MCLVCLLANLDAIAVSLVVREIYFSWKVFSAYVSLMSEHLIGKILENIAHDFLYSGEIRC